MLKPRFLHVITTRPQRVKKRLILTYIFLHLTFCGQYLNCQWTAERICRVALPSITERTKLRQSLSTGQFVQIVNFN